MKTLRLISISSSSAIGVCSLAFLVFCVLLSNCDSQTTGTEGKRIKIEPKKDESQKKEKTEKEEFPEFDAVIATVKQHLKKIKGYRKSDLITREQMQGVFPKLEKLGWKVVDAKKIQQRMLPSSHFLVRQLRSPRGKRFMRKMNSRTQSYSYLHRLSRMPHGKKRVRELIKGPDGHKMILYFSDSKYGRKTGDLVSRGKGGANFNKPTDIVYTAKQFADALEKSHAKAHKEWLKKKKDVEKKPENKKPKKKSIEKDII